MPLTQMQPGQTFFVGNGPVLNPNQKVGSDGNRGTFLDPLGTLNYAVNTATQSGRGDIVFVLPGHRETLSNATTLALNSGAVAVIGLGGGNMRPTFVLDTVTTANVPVRSSGVSIQNCLFVHNFADIASVFTSISASVTASIAANTNNLGTGGGGIMTVTVVGSGTLYVGAAVMGTAILPGTTILNQISGTTGGVGVYQVSVSQTFASGTITTGPHDFAVDNCEFRDLSSILNALTIVTGSGSANNLDGFSFTNNVITSLGTTAATTAIVVTNAQARVNISVNIGNWAVLNNTAAMLATGANSILQFQFNNNRINRPNTATTSGLAISTSGTGWTGSCNDNRIWGLNNTAQIWIDTGTKLAFNQNFCPITAAADKSGLINPAAV
jgi:hypothetical protein